MDAEAFGRDHVFSLHGAFRLQVQPNGRLARVDRLHNTADDLAFLFLEELVLLSSLSITNLLLNSLAGCLGGNATKIFRSRFHHYQIAKLAIWVDFSGIVQQNLSPLIIDLISNFFFGIHTNGSLIEIDVHPHFLSG